MEYLVYLPPAHTEIIILENIYNSCFYIVQYYSVNANFMKEVNHHHRSCVIKAETVTEMILVKLPVILWKKV